ncbi:hypothetical protein GGI12_005455 [Dipsacomyces acuminosporus]|nr:hypothetical protein GGI12_005455 [Dipsacomyces acuminosporus]
MKLKFAALATTLALTSSCLGQDGAELKACIEPPEPSRDTNPYCWTQTIARGKCEKLEATGFMLSVESSAKCILFQDSLCKDEENKKAIVVGKNTKDVRVKAMSILCPGDSSGSDSDLTTR